MNQRTRSRRPLGAALLAMAVLGCAAGAPPQPAIRPPAPPPQGPGDGLTFDPGPAAAVAPGLLAPPEQPALRATGPVPHFALAALGSLDAPAPATVEPVLDARILIVAADGHEPGLAAITRTLDLMGTPYEVHVAAQAPGGLTAAKLASGSNGRYQGVILTMGVPAYDDGGTWRQALTPAEWQALWTYESAFGVRQATWYTWPSADYGFGGTPQAVDTGATPVSATLTPAGRAAFPQLNPAAIVRIKDAYTYLARAADAATTPLLADAAGNALAAVRRYPDGRENLALTFDSNQWMAHAQLLGPAVVTWLTRGLFVGERKTYMSAQVDDLFYETDLFGGGTYRMTGADLDAAVGWQRTRRAEPLTAAFRWDMVFNGEGSQGLYDPDPLVPRAKALAGELKWVSHTYSHMNLDAATYAEARSEVTRNHDVAGKLGLPGYDARALVTGQVSGLKNAEAMRAAWDGGVRFVVSDTSRAGEDNPRPNLGIPNWSQAGVFMIPRRPTNLFYNVSTPAAWVAEYNQMYRAHWGKDLTYEELLEVEAEVLYGYLLRGELDPWMFHQANLRAYDGKRSLLGDLLDRAIAKYRAALTSPILSPTMVELGTTMAARTAASGAGVKVQLRPGRSVSVSAAQAATVPVSGLGGANAVAYGGVPVTQVRVAAGQTVTLAWTAAMPTPVPTATAKPVPTPKPTKTPKPKPKTLKELLEAIFR